jgi:hypothetical protein
MPASNPNQHDAAPDLKSAMPAMPAPQSTSTRTAADGASNEEELHKLGLQYGECMEAGKKLCLKRATIVYLAKRTYCRLGRDSQFSLWLERYAPDLDRKFADRLSGIIEHFCGGNSDRLSEFEPLLDRFRLTALYRLATSTVPSAAREEALAEARAGQVVTASRAQELIDRHTVPALLVGTGRTASKSAKRTHKTRIELDEGSVEIRTRTGDQLSALRRALARLENDLTQSAKESTAILPPPVAS